ncbi:hypothetical protein RISK_000954 [Rhodopirellula islandica]|uniref:Uncharacterized protein n=1 Tax=Rhodopirellula islandica TaxID=595434 RepID=A0A0J1BL47_RHOIS|nr:hypothetical protein [Rhodopirellula islandica]KLU07153.1 hypothetical protein RISK_000954 [Rhodopirellula islandica]
MFAPISMPIIHTLHGLTYRVAPVSQRSENEDPQTSRRREEHVVDRPISQRRGSEEQILDQDA